MIRMINPHNIKFKTNKSKKIDLNHFKSEKTLKHILLEVILMPIFWLYF